MNDNKELLMDWNDSIETDGQYVLLPEGDYNFTVTHLERGRFAGSTKLPACNKATIHVQVETKEGVASVRFDLILYRTLEWRISAFFRCIGQKKQGEKLTMDWTKVIGSKGRAHFKQRTYTNQNGEEKSINDIERFIDYNEESFKSDDLPF
jgi:hypothetical protein